MSCVPGPLFHHASVVTPTENCFFLRQIRHPWCLVSTQRATSHSWSFILPLYNREWDGDRDSFTHWRVRNMFSEQDRFLDNAIGTSSESKNKNIFQTTIFCSISNPVAPMSKFYYLMFQTCSCPKERSSKTQHLRLHTLQTSIEAARWASKKRRRRDARIRIYGLAVLTSFNIACDLWLWHWELLEVGATLNFINLSRSRSETISLSIVTAPRKWKLVDYVKRR